MTIAGLTMDIDSRMGKFGLSIGDSSLKVKRLDIARPDEDVKVSLDNLGYGVKLAEDDKTLSAEATYQTGDIVLNDVALGNGQAVIRLAKLDGPAVKACSRISQPARVARWRCRYERRPVVCSARLGSGSSTLIETFLSADRRLR